MFKLKLFIPELNFNWYILEYDYENKLAFGYVCLDDYGELGYFTLMNLVEVESPFENKITVDSSFKEMKLSEIKKIESLEDT